MKYKKITGLVSAPFTPFDEQGRLALDLIPPFVEHLVKSGVNGVFVCGSTGEGPSLSVTERREVAEAFVKASAGRLYVFVHVGHNSLSESVELAGHAQSIGADAISATPPSYFKIADSSTLVESMSKIAEAVPDLPFYYYHVPILTAVEMDILDFMAGAAAAIPNFAGMKYTAHKLYDFQACLTTYQADKSLFYGHDEMMLSALAVGAQGFIGSTYNFAAPIYRRLIEHFESGDMEGARRCQMQSIEMIRLIFKYGGLAPQKAIMQMIGVPCGPVRLPLKNMSAFDFGRFEAELSEIGFFEALQTL